MSSARTGEESVGHTANSEPGWMGAGPQENTRRRGRCVPGSPGWLPRACGEILIKSLLRLESTR